MRGSRNNPRHRRVGVRCFVLLDALVGVIVLGVALAGVMGLSAAAVRSQAIGEELQIASMIADEQLELVCAVGTDAFVAEFGQRGRAEAPWQNYEWTVDIKRGEVADPDFVTVTVSWERISGTRSITVETLIAPRMGDDPDPDREPEQSLGRVG